MGDPTHEEPAYCGLSDGLLRLLATFAQTPASVTATCKDCSSFSGTTRSGACRGHGGVQSWGTTPAATTPAPAPSTPSPGSSAAAAGGGPGQVWVNTASKVYHCPNDRYYGKTKQGEYMTEGAAKAAGDRPSQGKSCS